MGEVGDTTRSGFRVLYQALATVCRTATMEHHGQLNAQPFISGIPASSAVLHASRLLGICHAIECDSQS